MPRDCVGCIWSDDCGFGMPCEYYTPADYMERLNRIEEVKRRLRFDAEWREYLKYYDDDVSSYIFFKSEID